METKTKGNLLAKVSEVMDQSKTSYMHQTDQNKKFEQRRTFLDSDCYGNQIKSNFLGYGLQKMPKNNLVFLYPGTPNFTPTDQILWNDYEVILGNLFSKPDSLFFQNRQIKKNYVLSRNGH